MVAYKTIPPAQSTNELNATTGALLWLYGTRNYVASSPAVANGVLYVGSYDFHLYALNARTGALLWKYSTGSHIVFSSAAVANGVVYFGSQEDNDFHDSYVYALNASTGALLWQYATGSAEIADPAVANGVVYFGSWDTNVFTLDAFDLIGDVTETSPQAPDPHTLVPDSQIKTN